MRKGIKKRVRYNSMVIDRIMEKYGLSRSYVTGSLSDVYVGDVPDTLKKEYKTILKEVEKFIKQK